LASYDFEVTTTDADGRYWMYSNKKAGFVFISVPGGYMPPIASGSNIPAFFKRPTDNVRTVERHDFELMAGAFPSSTVWAITPPTRLKPAPRPTGDGEGIFRKQVGPVWYSFNLDSGALRRDRRYGRTKTIRTNPTAT
jgi:hypothetical protein